MTMAHTKWHRSPVALVATETAAYLRPVCGQFGIEQLKSNPSLDSTRPGS